MAKQAPLKWKNSEVLVEFAAKLPAVERWALMMVSWQSR